MDLYGHSLQINIHDLAMQLDNIQSSPVWLYKYLVGIAPGTSVARLSVCIISSSSKCLELRGSGTWFCWEQILVLLS